MPKKRKRYRTTLIYDDPTSNAPQTELEIIKNIEMSAYLVSLATVIALLFMVGSPLIIIPASIFL